jgi:tetratricopeptide (TPR) repeat protein
MVVITSNSTRRIIFVSIGAFIACLLFLFAVRAPENSSPVTEEEFICDKAEIDELTTATAAAQIGDAHFGGSREYSLSCARYAYTHALRINPSEDGDAWHQLGRIDFIEGNFNAALYKFNKQIQYFDDSLPNVYYMIGLTYGYKARESGDKRDWERAEEAFETYISYNPNEWAPRVDLAWVFFSEGKFEEMKPVLEEGLVNHPQNSWLLNMYGLALLNTGEKEEAKQYFEDALAEAELLSPEEWGRAYPGNDPALYELGLEEMKKAIIHNLEQASI